jgi:hypothetical protein
VARIQTPKPTMPTETRYSKIISMVAIRPQDELARFGVENCLPYAPQQTTFFE